MALRSDILDILRSHRHEQESNLREVFVHRHQAYPTKTILALEFQF